MASMTGFPTDADEGSVANEARWRSMARLWAPSGVVAGYLGDLAPTLAAGPIINVAAGAAWVDGHYAELASAASEAASANGLLVVRFTAASNLFELVYRDGATAPTQTDAVWETPLAAMVAGAMSDIRVFAVRETRAFYPGGGNPTSAEGLSSGTDIWWPATPATLVAVPSWATVADVKVWVVNSVAANAALNHQFRVVIDGAPAGVNTTRVEWPLNQVGDITAVDRIDVALVAGKRVRLGVQGRRLTGSGSPAGGTVRRLFWEAVFRSSAQPTVT